MAKSTNRTNSKNISLQYMSKRTARALVHLVADIRKFQYKNLSGLAEGKKNKKILELGSGRLVRGKQYYSAIHLFDSSNTVLQSDVVEEFGHKIIDVTKMKYIEEFDIILCLNVLEHVYDYEKAIKNMHKALKKGGVLSVAVPAFYPLHDEPHDYWRFTEHSLRKLLGDFSKIKLVYMGKRQYPLSYYVEAVK